MVGKGMKSMVLDLRSNPGGLRDEAVQAADLFLDSGQEILVSRGRAPGDNHHWTDGGPQRWRWLPIVVLVNRGTASAAEIIAGALQDHDRALVVGDTTYGKGIVQTLFPLGPRTALRITTARWYTPSGRSIQGAELDSVMGEEHGKVSEATYRSDAGRALSGGGGIIPDVALRPDTLSSSEQHFARALAGQVSVFRDVLTAYALELRRSNRLPDIDFVVTPEMRNEVRQRLAAKGRHGRRQHLRWRGADPRRATGLRDRAVSIRPGRRSEAPGERRPTGQGRGFPPSFRIIAAGTAGNGDAGEVRYSLIHHSRARRDVELERAVG